MTTKTLSQIASKVLTDLNDPQGLRWSQSLIKSFINDGYREFARETNAFQAIGIITCRANQGVYYINQLSGLLEINTMYYHYQVSGNIYPKPLYAKTHQWLRNYYGYYWQNLTGVPEFYTREFLTFDKIQIVPMPTVTGEEVTLSQETGVLVKAGTSDTFSQETGIVVQVLDADGNPQSLSQETGVIVRVTPSGGNLELYYSYVPNDLSDNDVPLAPLADGDVLATYAKFRAWEQVGDNLSLIRSNREWEKWTNYVMQTKRDILTAKMDIISKQAVCLDY